MGSQEAETQETLQTPVLENGRPEVPCEGSSRFTRDQLFAMAATACLNFSSMICYSILGPFFPREAEKKGASDTVVGLIFGCFALFNFLTSLILGNYLVQIGAKFMFVAGMFVSGCVTILFGLLDKAPDGPVFIGLCFLVRAMDAIGFAAALTASFSILAEAFPNNIATVMGSLEVFTGLGLVLGPPIGGFLYQSFGYEVPFIVLGCLVLILVPLNMYLLPKYDAVATKDSFWMLITLPKVVLLCFTIFSLSACLGFLDPTMSLFVSEKFKLPAGYVGLVFLGLALSYSLSSPLLGFLSDKMPHLRKWLLVFGGLLTALSFFLLGPAPILHIESKLWMFVLMLVLTGFSLGMSGIPLFPEMLHCAYENGFEEGLSVLGLVSGLFSAMWSLGAFVGPTLGGYLNDRLGFEWAAAIQGGWALLSGLAIGIFYILEPSRRRRSQMILQVRVERKSAIFHVLLLNIGMGRKGKYWRMGELNLYSGSYSACALDSYIAAVYEHSVILSEDTKIAVSPEDALMLMNKNMDVLEGAIKAAALQGARIIVTPEDGIYGWVFTRETIYPYLEDIPDPQVNWIPCTDPDRYAPAPVQERLSCMARSNAIYVVANIGDKKPCNFSDPKCPSDGHYQYNTDVVFDSEGKLVARYHKYNLFVTETQFDYPKEPEFVTFNTSFGKFGIFTCADILFHDPAVVLVSKLQVDTVLFPTAWMNTLPLLSARSGIYAPNGPKAFHYNTETENGHLLVAELSSHPRLSPTYPIAVNWSSYATSIKRFSPDDHDFSGIIYFDQFTFTELTKPEGNRTVCQKDLCCHLSYRMTEKREDEVYVLGAFDGLHIVEGEYYLQICTLLKCKSTDLKTCGQPVATAHTSFDTFSLSGTFGTSYIFPEVLLTGVQLAPGEFQVLSDGRLINQNGTSKPVLSVTLFGRWYEKDPPHPQQAFP